MPFKKDSLDGLWSSLVGTWGVDHNDDGTHKTPFPAWGFIKVVSGTPELRAGSGIDKVVDNGTGNYSVYFTQPLGSTKYAVLVTVTGTSSVQGAPLAANRTVRKFDVLTFDSAGSAADLDVMVLVVGGDP